MKYFPQPIPSIIAFLCGVSLHKVFFQHDYVWFFLFIPTLIFTIWFFYKIFKS